MKPEPINKHIVCSMCGLDWEQHGAKPTLEKCVELLKAEVKRLSAHPPQQFLATSGYNPQIRRAS